MAVNSGDALAHRSQPAQQGPPASLAGFPANRPIGVHWHREHADRPGEPDGGCWHFASLPAEAAVGGRFDLRAPQGTCYFGNLPLVAALERVGRFTAQRKPVPADLVSGRVVTTIDTATLPAKVANLLAKRASTHFGVTSELFTMSDYIVPQAWAHALRGQGHQGLTYTPRFSPRGRAVAVFGPEGAHPRAVGGIQSLREVLDAACVPIADIPAFGALTVTAPARRRA